jgi:hypothetical protein
LSGISLVIRGEVHNYLFLEETVMTTYFLLLMDAGLIDLVTLGDTSGGDECWHSLGHMKECP